MNLVYGVFGQSRCDKQEYYVDQKVIYDDNVLEGSIARVQDKQPGLKTHCKTYARGLVTTVIKEPTPSIVRVGSKKYKDQALLAMSAKAGILESLDDEPVSIYYADEYNDYLWADGQYNDYKKAITVKKNSESQNVILAHEYLHYVWFSGDLDSNQDLVNNLQAFYNRTSSLQTRMEPYPKDMVKPTEFFSYGCTEYSRASIGEEIASYCDKYANRDLLPVWL